jgi:A/G-specific adenine glycosylase
LRAATPPGDPRYAQRNNPGKNPGLPRFSADADADALVPRPDPGSIAPALAAWYARHRRDLPWRARRGETPDPYRVWLSEIMLQQTTVKAVAPYYAAFLDRWPDVKTLAAAPLDDVLAAWAGLGYYARARNLHACAKTVAERHGGVFPASEAALRELPGVGPYTAAAIAAIAFGLRAAPVDGNIERVVARLFAVETPLPAAKSELTRRAEAIAPGIGAGDHAQALMDLGSAICTPKRPSCMICPLSAFCLARARGIAERLPLKAVRPERPKRRGAAFVAIRDDGAILLRRRPPKGLLGGMLETPTSDWVAAEAAAAPGAADAPFPAAWREIGAIRHVFTHFELTLTVFIAAAPDDPSADGIWASRAELGALPSVMRKVAALALNDLP